MLDFAQKLTEGLSYDEFHQQHGSPANRQGWDRVYNNVTLSPEQSQLLRGFRRAMHVVVMAGTWCGDCVDQVPIFERFADETDKIQLHYYDRDAHPDLQAELSCCGAARVPAVIFLSEDAAPLGRYGDRTLAKYRSMATRVAQVDGLNPPVAPDQMLAAIVQEWLEQFERNQLILLTSPRLRQKHGD